MYDVWLSISRDKPLPRNWFKTPEVYIVTDKRRWHEQDNGNCVNPSFRRYTTNNRVAQF